MTLIGIQQRFREVGRIRTGEVVEKGGKSYPSRLDTFRLTSSDREAIDAAADKYGGKTEQWKDGWEVVTESDRLPVMLPPRGAIEPFSLFYELWSGGGIQRRCDGTDAMIGGEDGLCICDPEARLCKPTLRVSFLLPDLPGLGIWRLDTKSYNAAAEMPGSLNLLAMWAEQGRPTRAVLRLEKRQSKSDGQVKQYSVPVLDPVGTLNELFTAQPNRPALVMQPVGDEPPLLPHEIEAVAEAEGILAEAIEPADAAGREAVEVASDRSPSAEAGAGDPPPSAPAPTDRRGELAEAMQAVGLDLSGLEEYATLVGIPKGQRATDEQMDLLLAAVRGHGTNEPLELNMPLGDSVASTPQDGAGDAPEASAADLLPPRPATPEYRALPAPDRATARAYWATQKEAT